MNALVRGTVGAVIAAAVLAGMAGVAVTIENEVVRYGLCFILVAAGLAVSYVLWRGATINTLWLKALLLWFGILVLAFANGTLRAEVLIPAFGNTAGLISSGLILSACIFGVALAAAPWYGQLTSTQWLLVGAFWLVLTLIFEFGVGLFIEHRSWAELLEAYTFKGGNIWPLVLVSAFIAPWCAAKARGRV